MRMQQLSVADPVPSASRERGSALIMALLVSLVLLFLGMGLLLQTSLGLQASGTDRWVTKALYAADAGAMMQIQMIQMGAIANPGGFILEDDPNLPGLLKGQFTVNISNFCETQPPLPLIGWEIGFHQRFFHLRSDAQRTIGGLGGLTRASVESDVSAFPFQEPLVIIQECF